MNILDNIPSTIKEVEKPEDTITIELAGEPYEVFMSAGLASRLQFMVANTESLMEIYSNLPLQIALVVECLAPRDTRGKIVSKDLSLDDFDLGREEYRNLLKWVQEHIVYFFFEYLTDIKSLQNPDNKTAKLMHYLTGLVDSQTPSPSAGPSISSPAE